MIEESSNLSLLEPVVTITNGESGIRYLDHQVALNDYPLSLTERLLEWSETQPDKTLIAARDEQGEWERISYAEARQKILSLGEALLAHGLGPDRPLAVLSGNSLSHALLALACQHVGVPFSPISPAYSLISTDYGKLKHVLGLLKPAMLFVENVSSFVPAIKSLESLDGLDFDVLAKDIDSDDIAALSFDSFLETQVTAAVEQAHKRLSGDSVAKILFTSGSTGMPKGVINTHRMITANQQMLLQAMPFVVDQPPVLVDWLPWNHTFGGNHNFGLVMYNGGTLYIDDGKPTPQGIATTIKNLREISPTIYFNVPKGYEALLSYFRSEPALSNHFFADMNMLFYAGAGLSMGIFEGLQELAHKANGKNVFFTSSLGATETAPASIFNTNPSAIPGEIGLPLPGVTLKCVPNGTKTEVRVKGPNVAPGYWQQDELSIDMFDEEGFYKLGDAVKFVDEADTSKGLLFDGRVSEDFKLDSGTWVCVTSIRLGVLKHFSPLFSDVVVTGHDRSDLGVIVVPNTQECRQVLGDEGNGLSMSELIANPAFRAVVLDKLQALAATSTGGSNRVVRLSIMTEMPSLDAHEITDKGSLNQRAILENRKDDVETLYEGDAASGVFHIKHKA